MDIPKEWVKIAENENAVVYKTYHDFMIVYWDKECRPLAAVMFVLGTLENIDDADDAIYPIMEEMFGDKLDTSSYENMVEWGLQ